MEYFIQLTSRGRIGHFASHLDATDRAHELFGASGWQIVPVLTDHAELGEYIVTAREIVKQNPTTNKIAQLNELRKVHPMGLQTAEQIIEVARGLNTSPPQNLSMSQ